MNAQYLYDQLPVIDTRAGFIAGAEAVRVVYDPSKVDYAALLRVFHKINGKIGLLYTTPHQQELATKSFAQRGLKLDAARKYSWSDASEHHQHYILKRRRK